MSEPINFKTTQWSMVVAARKGSPEDALRAVEALCGAYWYPLYAYVRRKGFDSEEAQDLTQEFFVRFLDKNFLKSVGPQHGRFRAYLLATMNHFLSNEYDRQKAKKRGGGKQAISIDARNAEDRYRLEPVESATPERIFERRWAMVILDRVLGRVREEFVRGGRADLFDSLKFCLTGDAGHEAYEGISKSTKMSVGAVKTTVHRMRRRYRDLLIEEIAQTVESEEEVDDELRLLFEALSEGKK